MSDLTKLYPPFAAKVTQLLAACSTRGAEYKVTSTLRTWAEQDKLYAQGRLGPDSKIVPGGIVTQARGGQSYHNYGVAADFVQIVNGKPDWSKPAFQVLGEEAAKMGLEWGGGWKFLDLPHCQLPVKLADLQSHYKSGGMTAVWAWLDSK